jgi:hypothetical protein
MIGHCYEFFPVIRSSRHYEEDFILCILVQLASILNNGLVALSRLPKLGMLKSHPGVQMVRSVSEQPVAHLHIRFGKARWLAVVEVRCWWWQPRQAARRGEDAPVRISATFWNEMRAVSENLCSCQKRRYTQRVRVTYMYVTTSLYENWLDSSWQCLYLVRRWDFLLQQLARYDMEMGERAR